jgi:hypothetical protein
LLCQAFVNVNELLIYSAKMLIRQSPRLDRMHPDQLRAHADRIRAAQVLGRSELMQRLFDFLVACSLADKAPKEIEIAIDVFGKDTRFEVTRDAMVRVYMHKLRRKLEDYYAGLGSAETGRLTIPRGEYRLVFDEVTFTSAIEPARALELPPPDTSPQLSESNSQPVKSRFLAWPRAWAYATAAIVIVLLSANLFVWLTEINHNELRAVRNHPVWHQMVNDDQPIYIVLGDYYIFGELDPQSDTNPESVRRLVREFNINSRNDLDQLLKERPELERRYMDLALNYLPVSTANALHNIVPLLEPNKKNPNQVQVILASELTPAMIRSSHIVYIGLLSGMGILRDIAFAGSQFRIGDTYDELIDRKTNQIYVSQASVSINDNTRYRDYGYFATFAGPNNNRIVILAGTRDVALMHTAEAVSHKDTLIALVNKAATEENFEALYAVDAIDRKNLDGQLLVADKIDTAHIWASGTKVAGVNGVIAIK